MSKMNQFATTVLLQHYLNPNRLRFMAQYFFHFSLLCTIIIIIISTTVSAADDPSIPKFAFSWLNDKDTFLAGDVATIKIKVLGYFDNTNTNASRHQSAFNPTLAVNDKPGNSCFVSGVYSILEKDLDNWKIVFTPIATGRFNVLILEDGFQVFDSSLHFDVAPASIYPSVCVSSWMSLVDEFEAGNKATLLIIPRDAFGNNISSINEDMISHNCALSILEVNGTVSSLPNVTNMSWDGLGYIVIEFIAAKAGDQLLHVEWGNQTLDRSPLPFKVNPGVLEVSNCMAAWNVATNSWQLFSRMEIFIHQQDRYGNLVPGLYAFDAEVVEKDTNLSIPVTDLHFEETEPGIQFLSFSISEPGNFLLVISDMNHDKSISNMPYAYTVFIGYCDGGKSIINGSGLNNSVAGEMVEFSIYLNDLYEYPSPVEVERVHVEVSLENQPYFVSPTILPMPILNGSGPFQEIIYGAPSQIKISHEPYFNTSDDSFKAQASAFSVTYTPEKSGFYTIRVFCGNVFLNGGHSFRKEVISGEVNVSLSGVVKFAPKVSRLMRNEIVVQLKDSFSNLVLSQQSKINLEIASVNGSQFKTWMFVENNGTYTCEYMVEDIGTYEMCASFDGKRFSPCPFGAYVYNSEYFPKAYDDVISVWEDESIAFNALANDYIAGHTASIVEYSKPVHGSLLKYELLLRYTPFRDFYGNDSFTYTICDANGNLATASVNISVLTIPPQFVSFPSQLQATEDVITPRFGGYSGFDIRYSDPVEIISVTLSALSGNILLSPMQMQFWQPSWSELSVNKESECLVLNGCQDVINFALQSVRYLGNENFYGEDTVRVTTKNMNGVNKIDIPVHVEPINDPPFIHAPEFILLKSNENESLIFDKETDKFEFCIGDPDLLHYPGGKTHFKVAFSVEVNNGFLVASLPAELISTTELKFKNSYRWQPLQTYVTISQHFTVEANGIRFRGRVNDCNSVMQKLLYHGGEQGGVLTVTLSDMGYFGCDPDCLEGKLVSAYAEAEVKLIRRKPTSLLVSQSLGSAVVVESVMVFSLGVLLVMFTCKCAIHLVRERRTRMSEPSSSVQLPPELTVSELELPDRHD